MTRPEGDAPVELLGIGCSEALPDFKQSELALLYAGYIQRMTGDARLARRARLVFARAGIDTRRLSLSEEGPWRVREMYLQDALPTTQERMLAFRRVAPALACEAARAALSDARVAPEEVGALVVATCTGVGEPDLDVELQVRLGLADDVERSQLIWMSCSAAFPALRHARRSAQVLRRPALLVCVEVSSLHLRVDDDPGSLLAHALFADGAAALVVAPPSDRPSLATLGAGHGLRVPGARAALSWHFTDRGFRVELSPELPAQLERACAPFARAFTAGAADSIDAWCVHPGGQAILSAVEKGLGLAPEALAASREILRTHGNMSSPSVLYVLRRQLADMAPGQRGLMLGFGTGITIEGVTFSRGSRSPVI